MERRTLLISVPVLLLAAACGGEDEKPAPAGDPKELLAGAAAAFADAKSVAFALTSDGVPNDVNGVSAAEGSGVIDPQEPKFEGTITGRIQGINGSIDVIAIGDKTWVKLFTPTYQSMDLAGMGAPNPAMFFHPTEGLPALLTATTKLSTGKQKRAGSDILNQVSGKIPAAPVYDLLRLGDGDGEYDVTYGITDSGELRTIRLVGEFYGDKTSTYDFIVKDYGKPVDITEP
jgi:lipoprotein LprG